MGKNQESQLGLDQEALRGQAAKERADQFEVARSKTESRKYDHLDSGLTKHTNRNIFQSKEEFVKLLTEFSEKNDGLPVSILDFGCGGNQFARDVSEDPAIQVPVEITGVTIGDPRTNEQKRKDRELENVTFVELKTPTQNIEGSFDLIVAIHVFEHLPDPLFTLAELYRLLREGGELRFSLSFVDKFDGEIQEAREQLNDFLSYLESVGIDVEVRDFKDNIDTQEKRVPNYKTFIIRKGTSAPKEFPLDRIHYTENISSLLSHVGQYRFVN